MAQLTGVMFTVQSKQVGQSKWQTEEEFVENVEDGYSEGQAQGDAVAAFDAAVAAHTGGAKEYRLVRCVEQMYEARPV